MDIFMEIKQGFFANIRCDIDRYAYMTNRPWWLLLATSQGLWALCQYRFCNFTQFRVHIPLIRQLLILAGYFWRKFIEITTGIYLPPRAKIGKGLYIGHFSGIFINSEVVIGENCNISQGVTIGEGGRDNLRGCPIIGDRVYIAPGAKIFGKIQIGDDVAIGANAVVTKSLPKGAVAVGIPAQIINMKGSRDFIKYRGCQMGVENTND